MLRRIHAATERPVSLEELKSHVEAADFFDDDGKLEVFLDGAIAYVGKRCELVLAPEVYRAELPGWWQGDFQVLVAPVRDIAVSYFDPNGNVQELNPQACRWRRHASGASVVLDDASTLPALAKGRNDAVRIEIGAGFDITGATGSGDDPDLLLPPQARNAILMLTAHWYANREAAAKDAMSEIPFGVDALTRQIMVYR